MSKAKYQGYEQLETILGEALEQAAAGKGKERHATGQVFEDQPMQLISKLLGDNHGLAFQAIKKIQESLRLPDDRAERELLGAINYIAGMIIFLRETEKSTPNADELTPSKVKPALRTDSAMNTTTSADDLTERKDTVQLKRYNDLLAQYTKLEKRLLELN